MGFLVAFPLLEMNQHDSSIMKNVAILHDVQEGPSLMSCVSEVGLIISAAAQCPGVYYCTHSPVLHGGFGLFLRV